MRSRSTSTDGSGWPASSTPPGSATAATTTPCCRSRTWRWPTRCARSWPTGPGRGCSTPSPDGSTRCWPRSPPPGSAATTGCSTRPRSPPTSCSRLGHSCSPSGRTWSATPASTCPPTDVLRFLGRKLHPALKAEVLTEAKRRPEGWRIKHRLARNWVKVYDKASVLRVETTINNPREFRVLRVLTDDHEAPAAAVVRNAKGRGQHVALLPSRDRRQPPLPRRPRCSHTPRRRHRRPRRLVPTPNQPWPPRRTIPAPQPSRSRPVPSRTRGRAHHRRVPQPPHRGTALHPTTRQRRRSPPPLPTRLPPHRQAARPRPHRQSPTSPGPPPESWRRSNDTLRCSATLVASISGFGAAVRYLTHLGSVAAGLVVSTRRASVVVYSDFCAVCRPAASLLFPSTVPRPAGARRGQPCGPLPRLDVLHARRLQRQDPSHQPSWLRPPQRRGRHRHDLPVLQRNHDHPAHTRSEQDPNHDSLDGHFVGVSSTELELLPTTSR